MGVTTSAFTTATSLMGSPGASEESPSSLDAAYAQAENYESQAARKEIDAARARQKGALAQAEQTLKARRDIAERKAAYAAAGVNVNDGSAAEVAADIAAWSEYERQKIEADAAMESWGLKYDAALLRRKAGTARAAAAATSPSSSGSGAFGKQLFDAMTKGIANA